ncbi:MAG TPA: L-threonylcarbamoyladenylate synthase [Candidatus Eisenbacteria bacterium]|nr:L-threonylcarbamoyladenylate synthase [Candidatus Eisenbacteria bacterium]
MNIADASDPAALARAARILKRGGLVAFPTETVYGLGADATNPRAALKIFALKKRPAFDPLIVHALDLRQAMALWKPLPARLDADVRRLAAAFWPGPLTIVLPKAPGVPDVVTAGLDTVAVRVPSHPCARRLLARLGRPIAAPSANLFGRTSPTTARMVREDLGGGPGLILDGGRTAVGVESTVIEAGKSGFVLLRPGGVPLERLRKIVRVRPRSRSGRLSSPGLLKSHYAPRTPLTLMDRPRAAWTRRFGPLARNARVGLLTFGGGAASGGVFAASVSLSRRGDLSEAASELFQAMRKLDRMSLDLIVAERVPERGLGLAVMDRLRRASAGTPGPAAVFRNLEKKRRKGK